MSDTPKFYGIWDGSQWVEANGLVFCFHAKSVASATMANLKKTDGRYLGNKALKVALIPEDGGKPADE